MPISGALSSSIRDHLPTRTDRNYLGLDLSLTSTGMVFLTGDGCVDSFNITTKPKHGHTSFRIAFIRDEILRLLDTFSKVENTPELVILEGYAMGVKGGRVFTIGELGGLVKEAFRLRGIDVLIVPPNNLKKFIGASGAGKDKVRLELFKHYGLELETNDEVDAAVLSIMGLHYDLINKGIDVLKYRAESLEKCEFVKFNRSR